MLEHPDRNDPVERSLHIAIIDKLEADMRLNPLGAGTLAREKWPAFLFASRDPFPRNRNDKIDRRAVAGALASAPLIALPGGE